ncbi:hypothetical protein QBC35DRAFT_486355 [Podospora australis]|uniref:Uncharacterized protein n=1 Tax=Podospora australis TaxID=1536484 RepID=A0AAN7ALG9_9PEZI|nr:hypothetical protein QBC35DRAFT_486355 [Podospora australis]
MIPHDHDRALRYSRLRTPQSHYHSMDANAADRKALMIRRHIENGMSSWKRDLDQLVDDVKVDEQRITVESAEMVKVGKGVILAYRFPPHIDFSEYADHVKRGREELLRPVEAESDKQSQALLKRAQMLKKKSSTWEASCRKSLSKRKQDLKAMRPMIVELQDIFRAILFAEQPDGPLFMGAICMGIAGCLAMCAKESCFKDVFTVLGAVPLLVDNYRFCELQRPHFQRLYHQLLLRFRLRFRPQQPDVAGDEIIQLLEKAISEAPKYRQVAARMEVALKSHARRREQTAHCLRRDR